MKEIVEAVRLECVFERMVEQIGDILVFQTAEEIGEVVQTFLQECCQRSIVGQTVDLPVTRGAPEVREDILDKGSTLLMSSI